MPPSRCQSRLYDLKAMWVYNSYFIPGVVLTPGFLIYQIIVGAGMVAGGIFYKRIATPYKLLTQLLGWIFMVGIISKIVIKPWGTNFPVFHFLQILQLVYFGCIFYTLFGGHRKTQKFLLLTSLIFIVLAFMASLFFQSVYTFPSIGSLVLSFYVTSSSILLFLKMIRSPIDISILKQPNFWFASGSLFFYTITFFILGFFKFVLNDQGRMPGWSYLVLHSANYVLYTCYFITIFLAAKNKVSKK